ncbi:hypothetical protein ACFQ48_14075 [Hymenobacter caeli]|uniref:Restriction endonuclease n=1 Tax=Hymenobacter caeli TaxID=2735894 RepID=A0ABX2FVT0_9BACT|nr:hypothetical protein [Hymenobacter caeli]NRT20495.1 hypothetical protein [Hymenobacter caeli]
MEADKIFEDKERIDFNFANHLDDLFNFYDRSAKPEFTKVRNIINEWFIDYPQGEKGELKTRFRKTFSPAFFELFIYQLFTKQGFTLTPHPQIQGTNKAPDFLAEKGDLSFYIEAKEATDISTNEAAINKQVNAIYDTLSKLTIPNYWLIIEKLQIKSTQQPSSEKIIKYLERQLPDYIAKIVAADIELSDWSRVMPLVVDRADVKLVVRLFPKSAKHSQKESTPTIGGLPGGGGWGYPEEELIKSAVHKKASRYGELDKPYLICINVFSRLGITDTGVESALLGSLTDSWPSNPGSLHFQRERAKNGVFYSESGLTKTRVSGIFVTSVFPSNVDVARHWLAKHPCGKMELDFTALKLSHQEFDGSHWQPVPGQGIADILK